MEPKTDLDAVAKGLAETKKELDQQIADVTKIKKAYEEKAASFLSGGAPTILTPSNMSNSYEKQLMSKFGARGLPDLLKCDTSLFDHTSVDERMAVMNIKKHFQIARWISQVCYGAPLDKSDGILEIKDASGVPQGWQLNNGVKIGNILDSYYAKQHIIPLMKSFDSGTAIDGGNWVPTILATNFIPEFELERRVANEVTQSTMRGNPYEIPVQSGVTTARIIAEKTSMTDANFNTTKLTFNAKKYGEFYCLGEELTEDSAVDFMSIGRTEIVEAQMRARETGLLNGDDSVTHMDADTDAGAADLAEKGFKGYRKLSLANSANGGDVDFAGAAVTTAKLDEMITNMGKFGVNPRDVYFVFGSSGYNQAVTLPEVTSVEKFGPAATILTGALAAFRGKPVLISDFIREDLNAAGVQDGITEDRTVVHAINRKRFFLGIRRPIRTRVMQDLPNEDQWLLASYQRMDFQGLPQSATETSVVTGRSILV
jgi:hypothetical protein